MATIEQMLLGLREQGMTQAEIAQLVGVSQPTVHRAMNGAGRSLSYEAGKRIEALYAERVTRKAA